MLRAYRSDEILEFQTDNQSQATLFTPSVDTLRRIVAGKKVLFIDEAQSIEIAGLVLKLLVGTFRDLQVIATGRSSFELSDKIKESMVGHVVAVSLLPFSVEELAPSRVIGWFSISTDIYNAVDARQLQRLTISRCDRHSRTSTKATYIKTS